MMGVGKATDVFLAEIADAAHADLAVLDRVFHGSPAFQAGLLAAVGAVEEEEVDVAQPALLDALLDAGSRTVISAIAGEFGGVVDILAFELRVGLQVVEDGVADVSLVVVHLGRVYGAVASVEGVLHGS